MSQMLDNTKDANTVSTGCCLVHADSEEAYGDSWDGSADGQGFILC